jgi:hypothetical protein
MGLSAEFVTDNSVTRLPLFINRDPRGDRTYMHKELQRVTKKISFEVQ